jgi:hypothetical protein
MKQELPKNQEIIFPEEASFIIDEILKKYQLYREPKEIIRQLAKKIVRGQTFKEKMEISDNEPEIRLIKVIKRRFEEKITYEDLCRELQQIFNVSLTTAKSLATDLEKNVVDLAVKVSIAEEGFSSLAEHTPIKPLPIATPSEESLDEPRLSKRKTKFLKEEESAPIKKKSVSSDKDAYRESVE